MFRQLRGKEILEKRFQASILKCYSQNSIKFSTGTNLMGSQLNQSNHLHVQTSARKDVDFGHIRVEPSVLSGDRPHEPEVIYKKPPTPSPRPPYLAPRFAQTAPPQTVTLPFLPAPDHYIKEELSQWRGSVEGLFNINRPREPALRKMSNISSVGISQFANKHFTHTIDSTSSWELLGMIRKYENNPSVYEKGWIITSSNAMFCNGIDFQELFVLQQKGEFDKIRTHLTNWYTLLYELQWMNRPLFTVCNGRAAGSGALFWINSNFPIATGQTAISFPEASFGFFPDAGGSWALALEGPFGKFLALTGKNVLAFDNIHMGWGLYCMDNKAVPAFANELLLVDDLGDPITDLPRLYKYFEGKVPSTLNEVDDLVSYIFEPWTMEEILQRAEESLYEELSKPKVQVTRVRWLKKIMERMRDASPLALKVTLKHMLHVSVLSQEDAMDADLQLAMKMIRTKDFEEGVRARMFETRPPKWGRKIEDVTDEEVDQIVNYTDNYYPLGLAPPSANPDDGLKVRQKYLASSYLAASWSRVPPGIPSGITIVQANAIEDEVKSRGGIPDIALKSEAALMTDYDESDIPTELDQKLLVGFSSKEVQDEYQKAWNEGGKYLVPSYDHRDYNTRSGHIPSFGPPSVDNLIDTYNLMFSKQLRLSEEELDALGKRTGLPRERDIPQTEINKHIPKDVFALNHYHKRDRHYIYAGIIADLASAVFHEDPMNLEVREESETWDEPWWKKWHGNDVDIPIYTPDDTHQFRDTEPLKGGLAPTPQVKRMFRQLGRILTQKNSDLKKNTPLPHKQSKPKEKKILEAGDWADPDMWLGDNYIPGDTSEEWKEYVTSIEKARAEDDPATTTREYTKLKKAQKFPFAHGLTKLFEDSEVPIHKMQQDPSEFEKFFEENEEEYLEILNLERSLERPKKIQFFLEGEKNPPSWRQMKKKFGSSQPASQYLVDDQGEEKDLFDDDLDEEGEDDEADDLDELDQGNEEANEDAEDEEDEDDAEDLEEPDGLPFNTEYLDESDIMGVVQDPEPFPIDPKVAEEFDPSNLPALEQQTKEFAANEEGAEGSSGNPEDLEGEEEPRDYQWYPDLEDEAADAEEFAPLTRQPQFDYLSRVGVEFGERGELIKPRYLPDIFDPSDLENSRSLRINEEIKKYWDFLNSPQPQNQRGLPQFFSSTVIKDGKLCVNTADGNPIEIKEELEDLGLKPEKDYEVPTKKELRKSENVRPPPYDPRLESTGTIDAWSFELWMSTWQATFQKAPQHIFQDDWETDGTIDHDKANLPYLRAGIVDDENPLEWKGAVPSNLGERLYRAVVLFGYSRWPPLWQRVQLKLFIKNTPQLVEEFKRFVQDSEEVINDYLENGPDDEVTGEAAATATASQNNQSQDTEQRASAGSAGQNEVLSSQSEVKSGSTQQRGQPKSKSFFDSIAEIEPNVSGDLLDLLSPQTASEPQPETGSKVTESGPKIDPNWTPQIYSDPYSFAQDNSELAYLNKPEVPLTKQELERQYEELVREEKSSSLLKPGEVLALVHDWVRQEDEYVFKLQETLDRIHVKNSLPKEIIPVEDRLGNPDYFLLRHRPLSAAERKQISDWDEIFLN